MPMRDFSCRAARGGAGKMQGGVYIRRVGKQIINAQYAKEWPDQCSPPARKLNSAPSLIPDGHLLVTVFMRV